MHGVDGFDIDHLRDIAQYYENIEAKAKAVVDSWAQGDDLSVLTPYIELLEVALEEEI
jgi:hypothetical protein